LNKDHIKRLSTRFNVSPELFFWSFWPSVLWQQVGLFLYAVEAWGLAANPSAFQPTPAAPSPKPKTNWKPNTGFGTANGGPQIL